MTALRLNQREIDRTLAFLALTNLTSQTQTSAVSSNPDLFSQFVTWFWTNLPTIADLIIVVTAILGSIAFLLRQFILKPQIRLTPNATPVRGISPVSFWWGVKNHGHSKCYELALGVRVSEADYSQLVVSRISLAHGHNVTIGFAYQGGTNPPQFRFTAGGHPFVEGREVIVRDEPSLILQWNRLYSIEIEYNYTDSDTYSKTYQLEIGAAAKPILKLQEIAT